MPKAYPSAEQIRTIINANPTVEFQTLDLLTSPNDQRLDWAGLDPDADRPGVMAYQRLLSLHPDVDLAERMIQNNLVSANHIARVPRNRFVEEFAARLGVDSSQAETIHRRATGIRNKTMQLWASVRGTAGSAYFSRTPLDTVSLDVKRKFQNLPSYQDLFGTLDYVGCEECRSIFGPAAYLVDLLRIIDEYVTAPNSKTIDAPFFFSARRPDIADIELTCASTNDVVPYLQIVNQRLLERARQSLHVNTVADVIEKMATTLVYPILLPFNAPLDRVNVLLDKVGVTFPSILAAWKIQDSTVAARGLGLSAEQQKIVITEEKTAEGVAPFYNVLPADLGGLAKVKKFLEKTWSTFADLLALIQQDLSLAEQKAGLQVNFFINQGLGGKWVALELEKDQESYLLTNLGAEPLDKINRLLRLAARFGQPAQDVDWALRCVQAGAVPVITNDALISLARLNRLSSATGLGFAASTALLGPIKTYGQGSDGGGTAFDRLFNSPAILAQQEPYRPAGNPLNPSYKNDPLPWTPGSNSAGDVANINRVLPGLGIGLNDANALGQALFADKPQKLTVDVLSILYRHVQLSRALRLPIPRYVVFLRLMGLENAGAPSAAELERMVDGGQWLNQTGVSVYQLDYIIHGNPSVYVNPMYRPDSLDQWQQGLWQVVSPSSSSAGADIMAQVAVVFGAANTRVATLMQMAIAATVLPAGAATWEAAFLTAESDGKTPKYAAYVRAIFLFVSRWLVMGQSLKLADATLASVAAHPAAYLVPARFDSLPLDAVRGIHRVQQLMDDFGDQQQNLLLYIELAGTGKPLKDQLEALQKATGWLPGQVEQLLSRPVTETVIVERLAALRTCFNLMAGLESDVTLMARIADLGQTPATSWSQYLEVADDVLSKTAARYGARWDSIWEGLSGALGVHERDALLSLVLFLLNTDFHSITAPRNVYEFLLTDVEMGPVARISTLKEALNACQLYLQRCRLRLEPGVNNLSLIPDAWWEWMMNYRVWQANRQIFVYPENYLIPGLRKKVTQQFATLSQALQQSDITRPYVASAFRAYIDGFAEVAQLKPVDAYRTRIGNTETTYLLARTKTGPYTFFFCSQTDGMPWTPWEKIDLTINSPHCTLVYAFSRPFLFWNEIKKTNDSAVAGSGGMVSTTNSTTYRDSVMYSFINQEGKWAQAQTLVDQAVVFFDADDSRRIKLKDATIFDGLFDMDAPAWSTVFAFAVTAENYQSAPASPSEAERLVVLYGPNLVNTGVKVEPETTSPTTDPSATAFWSNLHARAQDHNRAVFGQLSGEILLRPVSVLNLSLESDVLVNRQEYLLTDPYQAASPLSLIRAGLQSSGAVIQVSHTGQPITDNRLGGGSTGLTGGSDARPVTGNSFITLGISPSQSIQVFQALKSAGVLDTNGNISPAAMATLDLYDALKGVAQYNLFGPPEYGSILTTLFDHMGATALFNSVGGNQASVAPVRGQPGWFVVFLSDEIFLLTPKPFKDGPPLFSTFAGGIVLGDPLLTAMSGVMSYEGKKPGSINAEASGKVIAALISFSLIANGQLSPQATLDNVRFALANLVLQKVITEDQIPYIYHALVNAPTLYADAFIGGRIDAATSTKIYGMLQSFSIIDPNGRIDEPTLTGTNVQLALSNLLLDGTVSPGQIAGIYSVVAHAPKAVALRYINRGDASRLTNTGDFVFTVVRLSTGAVRKVSRALFSGGIDALLDLKTQEIPVTPVLPFDRFGPSTKNLVWPAALDATQVDFDGLYGQYYWEIFYHVPMLVAYALNTNQQFPEAQAWLQYVFNPTIALKYVTDKVIVAETAQEISLQQAAGIITQLEDHEIGQPPEPILEEGIVNPDFRAVTDLSFLKTADPTLTDLQVSMVRNILLNYQLTAPASHFWRFRPFRAHTLETLKEMLSDNNPAIRIYNDDPFDPFAIARLRPGAFEKATLMQYVDNLIAWGDQLFTGDTWETITAAYMLYVYTYDLLGPKPQQVGEAPGADLALTFTKIKAKYPDGIPQFLIDLEHFTGGTGPGPDASMGDHAFNDLYVYFCVPENSNLMSRWDTILDRMYKINNSMNIAGVVRALPLFEPPLNPLDLVRAAAAGNNVQGNSTPNAVLSPYRYSSAAVAAQSLCATVIELGNSLLSVSEKSDAQGLDLLRVSQEAQILAMTTQIRQARIDELKATIQSLTSSRGAAQGRLNFYNNLIAAGLNAYETTNLAATEAALAFNILGSISKTAATIAYAVPQVGSPFAMTYGGVQLGSAVNAASGVFEIGAEISSFIADRAATMGGYARRAQDWGLQAQQALADVDTLTEQISAATFQLQAAQQELAIHLKSISQNQAIDDYLRAQFTSRELYQWMLGRLAAVYFQTYALALRAARQAEAAYQFEMDSNQSFVSFQYWDGLRRGLTAGDGLRLALNRMDDAYRTGDTRALEVERSISLAMTAPGQLLALKTKGKCHFQFSEALFDYDYPGQYARKIKTISISIPAVVGPYQNIKAILTQTKNSVATEGHIDVVNYLLGLTPDKPSHGLRQDWASGQSVAISRGVDDSGMFVLDFQDQRYLPFENTGAVSEWQLDMPRETNRFDFQQLSDVIITVRYRARFDGTLEGQVKTALGQAPLTGGVYLNAAMQSAAWQAFLSNRSNPDAQTLTLEVDPSQIGFFKELTYVEVIVRLIVAAGVSLPATAAFLSIKVGPETATPQLDQGQGTVPGLQWDGKTLPRSWNFTFALKDPQIAVLLANGFINGDKLTSIETIVLYRAKVF